MPGKRYKVTLSPEERSSLKSLVSKGKSAAHKLNRARILLKADESANSPAWTDAQIGEALDVNGSIALTTTGKVYSGTTQVLTFPDSSSVGLGHSALMASTGGSSNVAIGTNALSSLTTATQNVAIGNASGQSQTTGLRNTYLGSNSGASQTSGD